MVFDKKEKRVLKRALKQICKLSPWQGICSLMNEERIGNANEDGEGFTEYGFLPDKLSVYSDEEVQEWIDENMWEEIRSPYDCTGKRFSYWIHFHRNPCGRISYVHRMGIDV